MTTAQEAFTTYKLARADGWLEQSTYNSERNGRRIACALGIIDPHLSSPSQCPAEVMPMWLARMVPWLFDGQGKDDAFTWGESFYEQLARLNGVLPFEVVYDWHSRYSWQMGIDAAVKRGRDPSLAQAVQILHTRAAEGDRAPRDEWYNALTDAYANADGYANADANGYANADANGYANAYADANADAYANADGYANAYADAYADANAYKRKAISILANGLVECMSRVQP